MAQAAGKPAGNATPWPTSDPKDCDEGCMRGLGKGGGLKPDQGELSEGGGGTFGRLTLFNTARCWIALTQKAQHFKEEWDGGMMQMGVKTTLQTALTELYASLNGRVASIHILLEAGADVGATNDGGAAAFISAPLNVHGAAMQALLLAAAATEVQGGADPFFAILLGVNLSVIIISGGISPQRMLLVPTQSKFSASLSSPEASAHSKCCWFLPRASSQRH
eukprot:CAMPEP_0174334006 /NCGR_PEP_ID=MMETSP0810-20121108/19599_1 /TAXON_ID=73025 ORGANISM="Eutreptiella gymnastica-like, Strain CCMP1594" /NCGR_SAMPLE_ID=MMETSP0810 /ASSEMBLY_ACC=CAM_ASM_000659 /LENGTH=220 /DNA_ID=CAMNT_0015451449 /DNA_START=2003 /DNA_END=2665 /DNA_ORIENTATION=+